MDDRGLFQNDGIRAFTRGLRDAFIVGALLICAYFADQIIDRVTPTAAAQLASTVASTVASAVDFKTR